MTALKTVPKELISLKFCKVEQAYRRNALIGQHNHCGSRTRIVLSSLPSTAGVGIDSQCE